MCCLQMKVLEVVKEGMPLLGHFADVGGTSMVILGEMLLLDQFKDVACMTDWWMVLVLWFYKVDVMVLKEMGGVRRARKRYLIIFLILLLLTSNLSALWEATLSVFIQSMQNHTYMEGYCSSYYYRERIHYTQTQKNYKSLYTMYQFPKEDNGNKHGFRADKPWLPAQSAKNLLWKLLSSGKTKGAFSSISFTCELGFAVPKTAKAFLEN